MKKILFIEDDLEYAKVLTMFLNDVGYEIEHTDKSTIGLEKSQSNDYDLILCDLYLEHLNGNQLAEIIKMYNSENKIIIITSSNNPNDEIQGLRFGADDFVKKDAPFELILERIKKQIDIASQNIQLSKLKSNVENIEVDLKNRLVKKNDNITHLTSLEFDLLVYFLSNMNQLLSREDIIESVWKIPSESIDNELRTVDAHVKNIRSKLNISSIISIRGIGYRWHE